NRQSDARPARAFCTRRHSATVPPLHAAPAPRLPSQGRFHARLSLRRRRERHARRRSGLASTSWRVVAAARRRRPPLSQSDGGVRLPSLFAPFGVPGYCPIGAAQFPADPGVELGGCLAEAAEVLSRPGRTRSGHRTTRCCSAAASANIGRMPRAHDVIVAGAGPVGALCAYLLARRGLSVALLEREPARVIDYRASTFHPPTLDLLEDCGATAALLAMGLKAPVMQYRDRRLGKIAEIDFAVLKDDTAHPYRLQCEQFKLTEWLYAELARIPGAGVAFSNEVADVRQDEAGIEVAASTPSGPRLLRGR